MASAENDVERLGAVARLEQEGLAGCHLGQVGGEAAGLAREHQRRHGRELLQGAVEGGLVRPVRLLRPPGAHATTTATTLHSLRIRLAALVRPRKATLRSRCLRGAGRAVGGLQRGGGAPATARAITRAGDGVRRRPAARRGDRPHDRRPAPSGWMVGEPDDTATTTAMPRHSPARRARISMPRLGNDAFDGDRRGRSLPDSRSVRGDLTNGSDVRLVADVAAERRRGVQWPTWSPIVRDPTGSPACVAEPSRRAQPAARARGVGRGRGVRPSELPPVVGDEAVASAVTAQSRRSRAGGLRTDQVDFVLFRQGRVGAVRRRTFAFGQLGARPTPRSSRPAGDHGRRAAAEPAGAPGGGAAGRGWWGTAGVRRRRPPGGGLFADRVARPA